MAIRVTCPHCGRSAEAPDAAAGKKARCRGCRAQILIPAIEPDAMPAIVVDDDDAPGVIAPRVPTPAPALAPAPVPAPTPAPSSPIAGTPASPVAPPAAVQAAKTPQIPLEPWYYGFLEIFGAGIMFFGGLGCMGGILFGLGNLTSPPSLPSGHEKEVSEAHIQGAVWTIVISVAGMVPVLITSASIFLTVDAARNLRALRYGSEGRRGGPTQP
jgi:hypothetical protein